MSIKEVGGQAFPVANESEYVEGMTLRDYFAGQTLQGILSSEMSRKTLIALCEAKGGNSAELIAKASYYFADMLIERRKSND